MKYPSLVLMFITISFSVFIHPRVIIPERNIDKGITLVKNAYIKYDAELFKQAKEIFEDIYSKDKRNTLALYYITYTEFRFIEMSLTTPTEKHLFNEFYDSALTHTKIVSQDKLLGAEGKILQAGIYMFKMATDMSNAPTIYPIIVSLLDEVVKLEPNNPRAQIILGRMKFNTPVEFRGGMKEALIHFNKAISNFENKKKSKSTKIDWGYLDALIWAGQTYDKMGNTKEVDRIFDKIFKIAPNFALLKCIAPQ